MAEVILIQALPQKVADGTTVAVRLAGGGRFPYSQLGFVDWRAGVAAKPRFKATIGFGQSGFTGAATPQTATIRFYPSDTSLLTALAALYWQGARFSIGIGDDEATTPVYSTLLLGTVAAHSIDAGAITFTVSDLTPDLNKPVCPDLFAGTGGIEGGTDATGRVKRRTWGYAFNIEGRVLDPATNVYEFGDPNRPFRQFILVKDKGNPGVTPTVVAWAGTAADTLTALKNATPPSGGAAVAPSIACVKWWTQPAGPLTADISGEIGSGYVETCPEIAARLVSIYSSAITIASLSAALQWTSASAGVHVGDGSETVSQLLDRLLLPVSLIWVITGDGTFQLKPVQFSGATETLVAVDTIKRVAVYQPLKTRRLGYQRNYRQHSAGEIATTISAATDAAYADGTPLEALKPAAVNADRTSLNTAMAIQGQAYLATNYPNYLKPDPGDTARLLASNMNYAGQVPVSSLMPQEAGSNRTEIRTAMAIQGQGPFATGTAYGLLTSLPSVLANGMTPDQSRFVADRIGYYSGSTFTGSVQDLKPAQANADKTSTNTALGISGQGVLATMDRVGTGQIGANSVTVPGYFAIESGGSMASYTQGSWQDFNTSTGGGSVGGGGGGGAGGGGGGQIP